MRIVDMLRSKPRMLKVPECSKLLGVAENSFHELLKAELHPTFFNVFGSGSRLGIRIDSEDLAAWLMVNEVVGFVLPEDPSVVNEEPEVIPAPEPLPIVEELSDVDLSVVEEPPVPVPADWQMEEEDNDGPDPRFSSMSIVELRALAITDQDAATEISKRRALLKR
jgi:predicted DNA-binding transcriptional regulator AlpA